MKLTKKIIVAALAIVGLSFTACMKDITGNNIIKTGSNGLDAYVDYENTATDDGDPASWVRSLKTARQQHSGGIFTIRQTVHNTGANGDGMMGAVFGLTENKSKGTYNFFVAGTSIQNGGEYGYLSYFVNITKEDFQERNFGATKKLTSMSAMTNAANSTTDTDEYEWEIKTLGSNTWVKSGTANLAKVYNGSTKEYEIDIAILPVYDASTYHKYTGDYMVYAGKGLAWQVLTDSSNGTKYRVIANQEDSSFLSYSIKSVFNPSTVMGTEEADQRKESLLPQYETGYYVNVYAERTLTGEWELFDTINAVVEE